LVAAFNTARLNLSWVLQTPWLTCFGLYLCHFISVLISSVQLRNLCFMLLPGFHLYQSFSHLSMSYLTNLFVCPLVFILVFLTSPVSLSYVSSHLLTFSSHSPVFILFYFYFGPTFSQLPNQLLSFSFSLSLLYPSLLF